MADDDAYDLGQGAGFYVDAVREPWIPHFNMETYVTRDLIDLVDAQFPTTGVRAISGHSMGGPRRPDPGAAPPRPVRLGLGLCADRLADPLRLGAEGLHRLLRRGCGDWADHDAALLLGSGAAAGRFDDILVDQGDADPFLAEQLKPELLVAAAKATGQSLTLRMQPGYDHSYFFMASFIDDHIAFHAQRLKVRA